MVSADRLCYICVKVLPRIYIKKEWFDDLRKENNNRLFAHEIKLDGSTVIAQGDWNV